MYSLPYFRKLTTIFYLITFPAHVLYFYFICYIGDLMKKIISCGIFFCFLLSLLFGHLTYTSTEEALVLWFEKLVPSMFVTMVLIRLLYKTNILYNFTPKWVCKCLGLSKDVFAFLLCSIFLGFPAASGFLDEQCHTYHIKESQRKRLLYTCCFPTIGFVVLTIGEVLFHSLKIGFLLYTAQLFSGFTLLIITRSTPVNASILYSKTTQISFSMLTDAIKESGITLFMIGGYLMLFMGMSTVFFQFFPDVISLPLKIIQEFSSGVYLISNLSISTSFKLSLISMLLGFGGLCVHMQIFSFLNYTRLSYLRFLYFRILQALLSLFFFFLFSFAI